MKVTFYCGRNGLWYWRLVARNGKTIADGAEGYASRANVVRAFNRVRSAVCAMKAAA